MADNDRPLNRGAKILKKKLDKARVANANKRARKDVKPKSGTLTDRVKDAAKKAPEKRGLPAKIDQSRGNANRANPPKEIRLGGSGGTGRAVKADNFKPVPLRDKPLMISGPRGRTFNAGAAAGRLAGPVGALIGMTTPAGEGSDKPSGPLMRGGKQPGYKYADDGAMSNADVQKAYQSISRGTKTDDPVLGVRRRIATPKLRPDNLNTSVKKKVEKRGVEKKSKTRIAFEKEFAAARKAGKKTFPSKLGKFGTYSTKLK
jgi:hypothetical protein